jgi:hypothetical protein
MASFSPASTPTPCEHLYPPPYAPHALPISFVSILPPALYYQTPNIETYFVGLFHCFEVLGCRQLDADLHVVGSFTAAFQLLPG